MARLYVNERNAPAPSGQEGITTATVASISRLGIKLAWCGDSPAWAVQHDGEVVGLTNPSCHPCMTPCNVDESHGHPRKVEWPHRLTIEAAEADQYARLIVATDGITAHLGRTERHDHVAAMVGTLTSRAAPDLDGEYVLAQLLDLAKRGRGGDNTTIAVIDLLNQ